MFTYINAITQINTDIAQKGIFKLKYIFKDRKCTWNDTKNNYVYKNSIQEKMF